MTVQTLEISKRLEELAMLQENEARYCQNHVNQFNVYKNYFSSYTGSEAESWWRLREQKHRQWAADIRSLIIPAPLRSDDEKVEQHITCSVCGLIARIKYGSMEDVRPVSLRCSCGAITPYENQKD